MRVKSHIVLVCLLMACGHSKNDAERAAAVTPSSPSGDAPIAKSDVPVVNSGEAPIIPSGPAEPNKENDTRPETAPCPNSGSSCRDTQKANPWYVETVKLDPSIRVWLGLPEDPIVHAATVKSIITVGLSVEHPDGSHLRWTEFGYGIGYEAGQHEVKLTPKDELAFEFTGNKPEIVEYIFSVTSGAVPDNSRQVLAELKFFLIKTSDKRKQLLNDFYRFVQKMARSQSQAQKILEGVVSNPESWFYVFQDAYDFFERASNNADDAEKFAFETAGRSHSVEWC